MTDLSNFSIAELRDLQTQVANQIKAREKDEIARVQQEIIRLAKSVGMTPREIMNIKGADAKQKNPVAARYQNPEDAAQQWTGRGRKPKWVVEHLEKSGKGLDTLAIK